MSNVSDNYCPKKGGLLDLLLIRKKEEFKNIEIKKSLSVKVDENGNIIIKNIDDHTTINNN